MKPKIPDIRHLFEPRSVAIIGASHNPDKIGYKVIENIITGGYLGNIYPINPKGGEVLGHKVFRNVSEVEDIIDIACIVIPAKSVLDAAQSCAEKGVKFLVVISSGFSEVGNLRDEKELVAIARKHGMRVLGPNIFGIYSRAVSLNATFGPSIENAGEVAIITQSGAIGVGMIGKTSVERIGLSTIVSVGNKSDIDEADLLEYLEGNNHTRIIMMYMEGVKQGDKIVKVLMRLTKKKPVIVIKSGRSKRGAVAAASHTGSLAGADEVFDDIMKQCGVIRAENIEESLDWCKFLSQSPLPKGKNTLIITNGGGLGVLATDACEKYGVDLYDDIDNLRQIFKGDVSELGSMKNPIDITGEATAEDYNRILNTALECKKIHSVIALYCETALFTGENLHDVMKNNYQNYLSAGKPIVFSLFGGGVVEQITQSLKTNGVPAYSNLYRAISCIGKLYSFNNAKKDSVSLGPVIDVSLRRIDEVTRIARSEGRTFLFAYEARVIMDSVGIPMPKSGLANKLEDAIKIANEIGYPVVLKVVSKDILHKSDAGGVALDLQNKNELMDAYQAIMRNCKRYKPTAVIKGIEVTSMVKKGTETIIGARRDTSFGPICMFGMGGIYVEIMKDVSFRALPLSKGEVMKMIADIKSYPLLLGVRGEEKKDIDGIADCIIKVGSILQHCDSISDIEINPLLAYEKEHGVMAVDVRILLTKSMEVR